MSGQYYQQPPPPQYQQPPPQHPQYGPRFEHADILHRFLALLIDGIILAIISYVLGFVVGILLGGLGFWVGTIANSLFWALFVLLYFTLQEGGSSNATIGKKVMDLKVVDEHYQPCDTSKALIRNLFKLMISLPQLLPAKK